MRETPLPCVLVCLYECLIVLTPSAEYLLYPGHLPSRLSDGGHEALVEALRRLNTEGQIRLDSLDEVAAPDELGPPPVGR
ncbi:MAG: hypothetical protein Q7L55_06120 [Actinomycetota bacterium]|nr:hypothetical protein [Actinomycetota bacterium]